jgi:Nif-specific regulatory protein
MTRGDRVGTTFPLREGVETEIGRGTECTIVLADPICSRVHCIVSHDEGSWRIRDVQSRNGTHVNGQKVDEATLVEGNWVRVGGTEFSFHCNDQPPTATSDPDENITQTIIKDLPVSAAGGDTGVALAALRSDEQVQELLLLYQLSIKLLGCDDPDQVIHVALDLLGDRTRAAVVGFLWVDDEGRLKPKLVIPPTAADQVALSEALTELVCRQGHAVWIANQAGDDAAKSLKRFADAVCAPLVHGGATLGAIQIYLKEGRFRESDFDFTIAVANIVAVALVRARRRTSLETDYRRLVARTPGYEELIGESKPMLELKTKIGRIAKATGCVLVRGESGVGKELVARAIHRHSPRADRSLVAVNCAAIPADLMESQLFGHKAGSFTGADRDHVGYFQQADLGTLFLDEVGEMTLAGQAKLLRILEGHPFLPVGATSPVSVDVRVIAATNQDLQKYVQAKQFREDLYYRLSVFELDVPALRGRGDDIGILVDFFLQNFRQQHGRPKLTLSDKAREQMLAYHWPGNVRQLRNVMDSAVVLAENEIKPSDLALRSVGSDELETLRIEDWERKLIGEALKRTNGGVPEAARLLGIGRATLYRKIEQYQIPR